MFKKKFLHSYRIVVQNALAIPIAKIALCTRAGADTTMKVTTRQV
jgi:hypothetical protein